MTSTRSSGAEVFLGTSYLPGLELVLRSVQDADTALLLHRSPGAISEAMEHHRAAALGLRRFITPGGCR